MGLANADRILEILTVAGWSDVAIEPSDGLCDYAIDSSDGVEELLTIALSSTFGWAVRAALNRPSTRARGKRYSTRPAPICAPSGSTASSPGSWGTPGWSPRRTADPRTLRFRSAPTWANTAERSAQSPMPYKEGLGGSESLSAHSRRSDARRARTRTLRNAQSYQDLLSCRMANIKMTTTIHTPHTISPTQNRSTVSDQTPASLTPSISEAEHAQR